MEIPIVPTISEIAIKGPYFRKGGHRPGRQGGGASRTVRQSPQRRRSGEPQHDNRGHAGQHSHQTREQAARAAEAETTGYQEP